MTITIKNENNGNFIQKVIILIIICHKIILLNCCHP